MKIIGVCKNEQNNILKEENIVHRKAVSVNFKMYTKYYTFRNIFIVTTLGQKRFLFQKEQNNILKEETSFTEKA